MKKTYFREISKRFPDMEQMKKYVVNTKLQYNVFYDIGMKEIKALSDIAENNLLFEAIGTAFIYGQCKGYRQAKAEEKKKN